MNILFYVHLQLVFHKVYKVSPDSSLMSSEFVKCDILLSLL